ncbi:MAG: protein kinase domain-containing protein [Acidobacteriota bacterium]
MDEPLQKTLERYDVLDRIAVGGMAEVFLAKAYGAHGFEKTLAIKKILPELARDAEFEARFIAEAKVAVKLSHANVVQVFDFGRIGESLFIAMEYVDGLDLAALIRKFKDEGKLVPLPAGFHIAIEIIRALDFAHQHNVVHRDVSPSNILISRAGEVKIGDFGIAVAAAPHRSLGKGVRKVMGKWRYMSPEQTRGDLLDTRSDLFSAASVLFELFTGDKLFPGDEAEDIIKNIEAMPIPRASARRTGMPSRLDDILDQCLARKPIDRPGRPAHVLRQLIELSYESSIMATALDVAEAVGSVLPPTRPSGPGTHLDDVIRKQLGDAKDKSVARRTAVTSNKPPSTATLERGEHSTGLFRKIGDDGLSRLEEVEPTGVASPRARRATGEQSMSASSADSGLHKLLDAHFDPDRRTEVGGPPTTGHVPKVEPPLAEGTKTKTKTNTTSVSTTAEAGGKRRGVPIAIAVLVLAAGGAGAWFYLNDRGGERVVTPAPGDGRAPEQVGTLEIDPTPEGANGTIVGADNETHKFGPTSHAQPTRLHVSANAKLHVHIELPGYRAYDDDVKLQPGETLRVPAHLQRAKATLHVVTNPSGAQVELDKRVLGETELKAVDLDELKGGELVLTHAGYEPVHVKIDLVAGETAEVNQTLKPAPKFGYIKLAFPASGGWGYVYLNNVKVGKAPTPKLRLPVGHQLLHLENPAAHKKWQVACDVDEVEVKVCKTQMP